MLRQLCVLFSLLFILSSCDKGVEETGPGTIAIGEFRFTGTAESGQYAPQLFKLNRVVEDQFAQVSGWTVLEKESISYPTEPSFLTKVWRKIKRFILSEEEATPTPKLTGADYIITGTMDSFDVRYNEGQNVNNYGAEQVISVIGKRSWVVRSRVSMRIIDTRNQKWLDNQVLQVEEVMSDEGNVEYQISTVLERIADKIVKNTLLSIAGNPELLAINDDGTVILNRGSQHGLSNGMVFNARHAGKEVKNPENGKTIKTLGQQYGKFEIVDTLPESSVAKYSGSGMLIIGDIATPFQSKADQITTGKKRSNVRVAVGGFFPSQNVKKITEISDDLIITLDKSIGTKLGKMAGLSVIDQDSAKVKKMLTQQVLTDLGKDRIPGLPMGTLSGVDYLVFGDLVSIEIKKQQNPLEQMGVELDSMLPYEGELRAFLYLQDVNTGENVLGEEVRIHHRFKPSEKGIKRVRLLFDKFSEQASRRFLYGIRPLRVEWVGLDGVLLNHGADSGIKIGDTFEAFTQGEQQIDPYTGAALQGMGVSLVARLEVTGFAPQGWARAKCIAGQVTEKGLLLRRMVSPVELSQPSIPAIQPQSSAPSASQVPPLNTAASTKKKLVVGGIVYSPIVEKSLGAPLLEQAISVAQSTLLEKLHHDGGVVIIEQDNLRMQDMLKQRYLSAGSDPDLSDLMNGITGGDYILYTHLTSAYLDKGEKKYSKTLGKTVQGRSTLHLQASINIHNILTNEIAVYETVKMSKRWNNNQADYLQWSAIFSELMDNVLAKTLITLRPIAVSWVNGDTVGLNHGVNSGITTAENFKIYNAEGTGAVIARIEVTGFGPKGLAEARIVDGGIVNSGMLAFSHVQSMPAAGTLQQQKEAKAESRKLAW